MFGNRVQTLYSSLVVAGMMIGSLGSGGCKRTIDIRGASAPGPIAIDGAFEDWQGVPMQFFKDEDAVIGMCTDSNNLYIHFRTRSQQWARLIKRGGITVYLSGDGQEDKSFYVRYTDGPELSNLPSPQHGDDSVNGKQSVERPMPPMGDRRGDFEGMRVPMDSARRFMCYQKDVIVEKPIPPDGTEGPAAAHGVWQGSYSYELSIPLQKSRVLYYGVPAGDGARILVGLVWANTDQNREGRDMRPPGGGVIAGRGGGPGGGPPGSMGGSGMPGGPTGGQRPESPEKQEIWIKTRVVMN